MPSSAKWFKDNCHPSCLIACVASCAPGCCKEHDKVDKKTGLAKHCHPMCIQNCVPSCGSGCCSPEEERKRGHKFLHYQKVQAFKKLNDEPPPKVEIKKVSDENRPFKITDIHHLEKPHPPLVNPDLSSPEMYKPQKRLCPTGCPLVSLCLVENWYLFVYEGSSKVIFT